MPDKYKLNAFLIKEDYLEFHDVMKMEYVQYRHPLKEALGLDGMIFIGRNSVAPPDWVNLLQEGAVDTLHEMVNSSTRSVLLIRRNQRIFAFPFGFGRFMIKDDVFVRDFGIKVVLNSVNPAKLRSLDTATVDELTIHARKQTSRTASVTAFGIDIVRDLLRAVTGEPVNESYGKIISGRDSVQFTYELTFSDFGDICDHLLQKYNDISYRRHFVWFDNLQIISDPSLLETLNNNLISAITDHDENRFHLAPPEIIDWYGISGFSYTPGGQIKEDLLVSDLFEYLQNREVTGDSLKNRYIFVKNDANEIIAKWKLYDSFVFETQHNNETYILTIGSWFKIERNFVNQVTSYISLIPDADIILPPCKIGEKEGEYNTRVGEECNDVITLDRQNVYLDGSPIEVCDLLSRDGKFIHVKPWKSSSTLSHLFSQGRVSAISILQEDAFRNDTFEMINDRDSSFTEFADFNNLRSDDIEVVFAVIDSDDRSLVDRLPFFSKLNMMHTVKYLRGLNINVSKITINREA